MMWQIKLFFLTFERVSVVTTYAPAQTSNYGHI